MVLIAFHVWVAASLESAMFVLTFLLSFLSYRRLHVTSPPMMLVFFFGTGMLVEFFVSFFFLMSISFGFRNGYWCWGCGVEQNVRMGYD